MAFKAMRQRKKAENCSNSHRSVKKGLGVFLVVLAVLFYLLAAAVLAKEVHYSMRGLWFTITNSILLASFLAQGVGAFAPGAVIHYIGYRLLRSARQKGKFTKRASKKAPANMGATMTEMNVQLRPDSMSYTFAEKQEMKTGVVTTLVSCVLYGGIAWGITKYTDGGREEFFWILGVMVGMRTVYAVLEFVMGVIVWRLYGRRRTVASFVTVMREGKLPKRVCRHDNISNYFSRILEPMSLDYRAGTITPDVQKVAADMDNVYHNEHGFIANMRIWDAMNRALEIHSPAENFPESASGYVLHWLHSDATESEIQALPNASPELVKRIVAERPFETLTDLYQLLRDHGLDRMQADRFLHKASAASDEWNEKRMAR